MAAKPKNRNISSPVFVNISWKRPRFGPVVVLGLYAFEFKRWSSTVNETESLVYFGSPINNKGKASTDDNAILLNVLDITDNMAPSGSSQLTVDLNKVNEKVDKILISVAIINKSNCETISFKDFEDIELTITDHAGFESCSGLKLQAPDEGMMALDLGIIKRSGTNWCYENNFKPYAGGFDVLTKKHVGSKAINKMQLDSEIMINDLLARIAIFREEDNERYRRLEIERAGDAKAEETYNQEGRIESHEEPDILKEQHGTATNVGRCTPQRGHRAWKSQVTKTRDNQSERKIVEINTEDSTISTEPIEHRATGKRLSSGKAWKSQVERMLASSDNDTGKIDTDTIDSGFTPLGRRRKFPAVER